MVDRNRHPSIDRKWFTFAHVYTAKEASVKPLRTSGVAVS